MSVRVIDNINAVLTTTTATATTATTFPTPSACSFHCQATITFRDTSNNVGSMVIATRGKNTSGTNNLVGSLANLLALSSDVALATASATISVSGANILVSVIGVASTTIEWFVDFKIWIN